MEQSHQEAELIDRIARGGVDATTAFTALVCQTRTVFVRRSKACGLSQADAEDVVGDIFTKIWTNPEPFLGRGAGTKFYILKAVRNRSLDRVRSNRRLSARELSATMVDEDGDYAGEVVRDVADREWWETSSTELGLESLEKEECYVECLGALSTAHQRVLELTLVAGLHPTEIAEATEQKLETVKTRLHYAAKKMTGCVVDCANGHKA